MPRTLTEYEKLVRACARAQKKMDDAEVDFNNETSEERMLLELKNASRQGRPTLSKAKIFSRESHRFLEVVDKLRAYEKDHGLEEMPFSEFSKSIKSDLKSKEKTGGVGRPKSTELDILEASIRRIKIQDKGRGLSDRLKKKLDFLEAEFEKKFNESTEYEQMYHVVKRWRYTHRIIKGKLKDANKAENDVLIMRYEAELKAIANSLARAEDEFDSKYGKVTKKKLIKRDLTVDFVDRMTDINTEFYNELRDENDRRQRAKDRRIKTQELLVGLQRFGGNLSYPGDNHAFDTQARITEGDYSPMSATFNYSHEKQKSTPEGLTIPKIIEDLDYLGQLKFAKKYTEPQLTKKNTASGNSLYKDRFKTK